MKLIVAKIRSNFFPLLLVFIALVIVFKSYTPETILSGWDTLHPEFNFEMYFKRILTVWQSHQGLGAPPSQSHAGDLLHAFILWIISFLLPMNLLRYTYILSMLIIGPLGVYFFLKDYVFDRNKRLQIYAFIGALFYLLNLGTLQNFYTPLEMFAVFYGFIGWFFWAIFCFFEKNTKKNFLVLLLFTFLLTPVSHTATLWYVFYLGLGLFLATYLILNHFSKELLKKSTFILVFIFLSNAFWILPNLYYAKNYSKDVRLSKTHRLLSNEFFLRSQRRGTIKDLALLTNFPFDWNIYDFEKNTLVPQMDRWLRYSDSAFVKTWGFFLFLIFLGGVIFSWEKKKIILLSFLPILLICLFFLRNANPPLTTFFLFLRERFSFFSEIFRFPFTKFSLFYIFFYSIFIAYALSILISALSKTILKNFINNIFFFIVIGQIFYMLPAFETGYLSPYMKVKIPEEYFQLFQFLDNKPSERILTLPIHSPNGWVYHRWGYQGAGFIWFGIQQPILNREFDRWYPYNEQAYRELSFALYSRNRQLFLSLLNKYRIGYVLLDDSVVDTDVKKSKQVTFMREAKELLENNPSINLAWQSGFLSLYQTASDQKERELKTNLSKISPSYRFTSVDQAYQDFGDYISTDQEADFYYPFRTFINEEDKLSSKISLNLTEPTQVIWPKDLAPGNTDEFMRYQSLDKITGFSYELMNLSQDLAYTIAFRSKHISGLPLRICIRNLYSQRCDIYDELSKKNGWVEDVFILPPMNQGNGYRLEIGNISFGNISTVNELAKITIVPLAYPSLKEIRIEKRKINPNTILVLNQAYEKNWKAYLMRSCNTKHVTCNIKQKLQTYLPFLFGEELKNHVLVNNWANGWALRQGSAPRGDKIVVVFWPQYLEFVGFGLLIFSFIFLVKKFF